LVLEGGCSSTTTSNGKNGTEKRAKEEPIEGGLYLEFYKAPNKQVHCPWHLMIPVPWKSKPMKMTRTTP